MAFYHELILNDSRSTARLYYNSNSGVPILIGTAPLRSPFVGSVDINWVQGSDFVSAIKEGFANTTQAVTDTAKYIRQGYEKSKAELSGLFGSNYTNNEGTTGESQIKVVTASDSYAKYGGSEVSIGIPELEFIYINTGNNSFINKVQDLLNHTLPYITGGKNDDGEVVDSKRYYRLEVPPNDYRNPMNGFDASGIQRDLRLRIGVKEINHVLPTRVEVEYSQTGWVTDSVWKPHFIKVRVGLRLAAKLTSNDMYSLFLDKNYEKGIQF